MVLSKELLANLSPPTNLAVPSPVAFDLPERVLQFGTGVFIRGLIDYYIDRANDQGLFNGRVVMVKSTTKGDLEAYSQQNCLYTVVMRSLENGTVRDDRVICAAVSRVLDARTAWEAVLDCAANPEIQLIISNTTEVGIELVDDDISLPQAPASFPGKLLAVLYKRFQTSGGTSDSGFVIVPTELIPDNGTLLKFIVNELALKNKLSQKFTEWLNTANDFCNSLVDRIVPGKPSGSELDEITASLGYTDNLLIAAETFGLWAIETKQHRSREILSFSKAHEGIHLVDDISKFRELKLRLLNGSHNLSCALGFLAGFETVIAAMNDETFNAYMRRLILDEIAAAILSDQISEADAAGFGISVLERYRNPFIKFSWLDICVQDTSKMKIRAVPIITQHYSKYGFVPNAICLGFAAYILFMKALPDAKGIYRANSGKHNYVVVDDYAPMLSQKWEQFKGLPLVKSILGEQSLWATDLSKLNGFAEAVNIYLDDLTTKGFLYSVKQEYASNHSIKK